MVEISCVERPVDIVWFGALTNVVSAGDNVTLSWATREATSCEINPGTVAVSATRSGNAAVVVNADMDFILTCEGQGGPVSSAPVTVRVTDSDRASVSAGDFHTCAIKTDGTLYCWGSNSYDRLGNDSVSGSSLVPVQESTAATDWASVSAGYTHTCAIKTDGTLYCWGSNVDGKLGNNSTTDSTVPLQESTAATDWAQISAGGDSDSITLLGGHTCAIKTDDTLFCWGDNSDGQLGRSPYFGPVWPAE